MLKVENVNFWECDLLPKLEQNIKMKGFHIGIEGIDFRLQIVENVNFWEYLSLFRLNLECLECAECCFMQFCTIFMQNEQWFW